MRFRPGKAFGPDWPGVPQSARFSALEAKWLFQEERETASDEGWMELILTNYENSVNSGQVVIDTPSG
jgi:hypothetical protein